MAASVFAIRLTLRPWEPSRGMHTIFGTTRAYLLGPPSPPYIQG